MEIITHNERETELFGRQLAGQLKAPVVLCLYGELGSGKTALVRGLAEGMGLKCTVSSPTFTIVNEYPGNPDLIHFDMYRLHGADELFDIGWEDYLRRDAILAVEWSENVEDAFDGSEIVIRFEKLSGTDRRITAEGGPCADTCV
ncbi:MAG: tRNA (adenosine(37)-N6)-threonylcarbamoyltransferase complex ATPase subunit type 1 TsaE [Oscillospiraceae bacterium]|nr:tRNA (adenosine(37)-N6)-threonylcarbamoyltransferase complex ATPase subunit type 1 TsaE [Oscillospiraceae bacterium]